MSVVTREIEWRDASEGPSNMNEPILYCTKNNKLGTFKNTVGCYGGDMSTAYNAWERLFEKYSVKYWVYQNEILP